MRMRAAGGTGRHEQYQGTPAGPAPAGRISARERHALAIRQSLRWAERAASEGDYERALSWLAMVERVDGALPDGWARRREAWQAAWVARASGAAEAGPAQDGARPD